MRRPGYLSNLGTYTFRPTLGDEIPEGQILDPEVEKARQARQTQAWLEAKSRWGTTTSCYATSNVAIPLGPNAPTEVLLQSNQPQKFLTQDEVDTVTTAKNLVESELTGLQSYATKVIGQWNAAKTSAEAWIACNFFCSKEETRMNGDIDSGNTMLSELGNRRYAAFKNLDMLMVYSPTADGAQRLCIKKQEAYAKYSEAVDQIAAIATTVHSKVAEERKKTAGLIETLIAIFQGFIDSIKALIAVVQELFKGIAASAAFIAKYPKAFLYLGIGAASLVGLTVLAFVFRPYFQAMRSLI